jgi:bifunctional oligoribonuclease and PAP phosphatase NrnA
VTEGASQAATDLAAEPGAAEPTASSDVALAANSANNVALAPEHARTQHEVVERIEQDSRFVIATHQNPDGDAVGSLVAMHGLLASLGKEVEMFMADGDLPLPQEYRFFDLPDLIHEVPAAISEYTVILLDCGNLDRTPASALRGGAHLLNIDHHHDNTRFGTLNYIVPQASCTAEIVWEIMNELEVAATLGIAEALYVALVTDTGRFMYENTGPRAHEMAAALIEAGVDVQTIFRRLYEEMPLARLKLLGLALSGVRRFDEGELTLAVLSAQDFLRTGAAQSDSEGIVDHLRAVQGTKVAALVRELLPPAEPGERKVSLRAADDDVDVSRIARAQGGGGHRRAAGFSTALPVDELISVLRREIAVQLHPVEALP